MALETEIAAFEARKSDLETHHMGKFVVFHGDEFVGAFDTLENAAAEAVRRFDRGPYLIRQVDTLLVYDGRSGSVKIAK